MVPRALLKWFMRATLAAWGFLTVGIILGAWWSYEVLGWGGFWGWDPVENASLLPWLTGTAYLHSVMRSEEHTSELQSLMRTSYAVFCLQKKNYLCTT